MFEVPQSVGGQSAGFPLRFSRTATNAESVVALNLWGQSVIFAGECNRNFGWSSRGETAGDGMRPPPKIKKPAGMVTCGLDEKGPDQESAWRVTPC